MDRRGLKMYVDPRDIGVVAHLITSCSWEPNETRLVRVLAKDGQKWIEAGANFGYYTIILGDILRTAGKLYAFEGSPRFMKYLKDSVAVDGLENSVQFFQNAVYKESGIEIMFSEFTEYAGGSHIAYVGDNNSELPSVETIGNSDTKVNYPVQTITIDVALAHE